MSKYSRLLERVNEIQDLRKAVRVLAWDREVNMPSGGDKARANQISTLKKLSHLHFSSDEMGELIEAAAVELNGVSRISTEASLVRHLKRSYAFARKVPAEFVSRQAYTNSQALAVWKKARAENNFVIYEPWLSRLVELAREHAEYLGYEEDPYDALLDIHEPGVKTSQIRNLFQSCKIELRGLYKAIHQESRQVQDDFLHQRYEIGKQQQFAHYLAEAVGYDFERGHLATAVHPFSTSFARDDVRITTRYNPDFINPSIFATLHEAGHAIYVQNVDEDLARTPLAKETSAGFDESQSRMIENIVGRSLGFWRAHLPRLAELFPSQLSGITPELFYRAINKVQPGFIRVDADELTYNLHIILRFELELDLLNQRLQPVNLPEAWNEKMKAYLGIQPRDDREGCLQDIHWPMVGFGYFPSYALGNLYAAQLFESATSQEPAIVEDLEKGQTGSLNGWLRVNIHRHGRKFEPAEIILAATGSELSEEAFIRYAKAKFGKVYGIEGN